jgi:uncharacterized protein YkwD
VHGRRLALCAALALTGAAASAAAAPAAPAPRPRPAERALLNAMNAARTARDLPALRLSPALIRPARAHSAALAREGRLEHEGPGGAPFWQRLVEAGYPANRAMAENLALVPGCGTATAVEAVRLWLASPGHRANLLSRRYRWVGPGVAVAGGCDSAVYTADFGG